MAPVQPAAQHIPAWKRLGLKLKNAKDDRDPTSSPTAAHAPNPSKRRKVVDDGHVEKHAKKAKMSERTFSDPPDVLVNGSDQKDDMSAVVTQDQSHPSKSESTPLLKTPAVRKRKSVTFAPDAKTADGDSTKDLYDRWLTSQKITDAKFDPTRTAPALKIHSPIPKPRISLTTSPLAEATNIQKRKKKKKKKKRKSKSKSTTLKPEQSLTSSSQPQSGPPETAEDTRPHPALLYLTEYHTSPSTWKFSKNYQKYLLKNLFSLDVVPSSYESALQAYLSGLKGTAARQSLREAALRIREEDNMWLSDIIAKGRGPEWEAKRKREQYERAWKREKDRLEEVEDLREWEAGKEEFEWKARKRRRAEQVLGAIGEAETQLAGGVKISTTGNTGTGARKRQGEASVNGGALVPGKKKRTRKRRTTGVPDDEDTSSSDSSSSSSDSDSEYQIGKRTDKAAPASGIGRSTMGKNEDETSSDDSESSSADSQSSSGDSDESSESESDDDGKKR